jgi:AraC-like DNA-binding protein
LKTINDIKYKIIKPEPSLSDFVESFWMLENNSETEKEIVVVPDGRIDIFFSFSATDPFNSIILGIETEPTKTKFAPRTKIFAVSLNLLAVEYVLHSSIAKLLNDAQLLPNDFWNIKEEDLKDFDQFCNKTTIIIKEQLQQNIDIRKRNLFHLIYSSNGAMTVKELSEKTFWSSRQINRYFNQQFGLTLKAYCNILRFRASFQHIKDGKLFPEQNFADQAHFIKEVKKLAGVNPKKLAQNQNDRFIQFSTLNKK